ncbi:uncharacterized protein ZBIST_0292 [Zygosaccharomyces bailii]|nr:uncharacterized protein ZBIST_0292 [Zygosaccharomyces bailii]
MMESTTFFKDHEVIYNSLINRLEQLFSKAYDICHKVAHPEDEMASEVSADVFEYNRESKQIMRTLTQFKVYSPIESDDHHGCKRFQLINQNKVISIIWNMLRDKLKDLTNDYVENTLRLMGDLSLNTNLQSLFIFWDRMLITYNDALMIISPLLGYLTENYPLITKEIPRWSSISDYSHKMLIEMFKIQLGSNFVTFLETSLDYFRFQKEPSLSILEFESPLALMYKYNIAVNQDSTQDVKDFYFKYLSKYVQNELNIPLDIHYLKTLINNLRNNSLLTGAISPSLIEGANDIFLQHTVLQADTAAHIIDILKTNLPLRFKSRPHSFDVLLENFQWIITAFETRNRIHELEDILRRVVKKSLQRAYHDPEKLFSEVCKFVLLADKNTTFVVIPQTEMVKILGGSLNAMELYTRLCETNIRRANRKPVENFVDYYTNSAVVFYAPILLHINSTILNLYSRSLFRRAIMQGVSPVIKSLTDTRYLESNMLKFFKSQYGTTSEYHTLEATQEIIYKASSLQTSFEQHVFNHTNFMIPLVFEKKMVPIVFQESRNEDVNLPEELMEAWNEFIEFFKTTDKKAKMKKLHLVYHLQHCEVVTPYKLKNGKKLIFELTLYQTCLLSLFNEFKALSYREIMVKLRMTTSTLATVLTSFTEAGLLSAKGDIYALNKDYSPDKRRVKDGKLRIPLSKPAGLPRPMKQPNKVVESSQHREGHSSQWKQELVKACIVRSLKGERNGLNLTNLFKKVEEQIRGISMGEFKDALHKVLSEKFIASDNDLFVY